jgi:hypothetical protein
MDRRIDLLQVLALVLGRPGLGEPGHVGMVGEQARDKCRTAPVQPADEHVNP